VILLFFKVAAAAILDFYISKILLADSLEDRDASPLHYHYNHFIALWILTGTTQVSRYQKKHSPTHTHRGHQSSFICFIHLDYHDPWYPPCSIYVPDTLCTISVPSFLWSTSWPGTLQFILHTFLHPIIVFFLQHCPYHRNLFCCSSEIISSNPSLSQPFLGTYLLA